MKRRIVVGRVSGVYGIRGWVKLYSHTRPAENLLDFEDVELRLGDEWKPMRLSDGQVHGNGLIGRFEGIDDRDAAAALLGADVAVDREDLPEPGKEEYYWADLVGLEVVTAGGVSLGRVASLMETGANDVMIVEGDRERLVPFTPGRHVQEVDLDGGRIVVDWDPEF
jgi:16S rRNA processing protein RimM